MILEKNRFQELINRLELFIRKYYTDKVLKGIIYLVFSTSLLYGGFVLMEDVFYFESVYRKIILFSFLGVFVLLFCVWIVLPLIKLFKFSKRLSYDEAAVVIGEYFPDISDSLINTINLNKHIHESETSVDLLIASINQRIENIKPFDFRRVIDFRKNISYLRWAIIPLLIVIIVMLFAPEKIILPTKRIVHFKQHFEKPQPFHFKIENSSLSCLQNSDFEVICTTYGDVYPEKVYIVSEGQKMLMKQNSAGVFTYVLRSLQKDMKFNFESAELRSKEYLLEVFPVPVIIEFETELDFPAYTKKRDEILKNSGDLFVPEGTAVRWNFFTRDVKGVKFSIGTHDTSLFCNDNFNKVSYKYRALKSFGYEILAFNKHTFSKDTLRYNVNVIKDDFPQIEVKRHEDSVSVFSKYFTGFIRDDYGFSKLKFVNSIGDKSHQETLKFNKELTQQEFYFYVDFKKFDAKEGETLEYYFVVYDNDAVNGFKMMKSEIMKFSVPGKDEILAEKEKRAEEIKNTISGAKNSAKNIKDEIDKLRRKLVEKEKLEWKDEKLLKELVKQNEEVKKALEKAVEKMKAADLFEEQFKEQNEEIRKKQEALQELMKKVLDDEFMELLDELREMMEKMDSENTEELLDKLEMSADQLEEHLDRSLELFKKLDFEKKFMESEKMAEELFENQKELNEKTEQTARRDIDTLSEEQKQIEKEYEQLKEKVKNLEEKDSKLEQKTNFSQPQEMSKSLDEEFEESLENMQQNKKSKAKKNQENIKESLSSIMKNLQQFRKNMERDESAEDMDNLKQLLENIVDISFKQEDLLIEFSLIRRSDPRFVEKIREQYKIKQEIGLVKDSLQALAKRQIMIQPFVLKEIKEIDNNVEKAIDDLNERHVSGGTSRQQYVMTHLNNLALFLNEVMDQMNQSMNSSGSGSGKSQKKSGKPSMSELRKQQQQLKEKMQQMMNGKMPDKSKGKGKQSMSEGLARLAAQQAAIRREMEELRQEKIKNGDGDSGLNEIIKKMEQNEVDLINRRLTETLIRRQKEIESHMLKSEKAIKERDKEKKREGKEIKNHKISNPINFLEYNRIKESEKEIIKTIPPSLKPEYKKKVNRYLLETRE